MRYALAIGVSLLVHAVGFGVVRAAAGQPAAVLVTRSPDVVDLEVTESPAPLPHPTTATSTATATVRRHRGAAPRQAAVVAAAPVVVAAASAPALSDGTDDVDVEAAPSGDEPGPPAAAAAPQALDLRPFFQRLKAAAHQCAGTRRGDAQVRFCVDGSGRPTNVSLVKSSGNFALDDAALGCVIPRAAPLPLTDQCLVVPLVFK